MELLTEGSNKQHGDSVLQVAVQENEEIFNKIKEEGNMCEALRRLMEPEIKEEVDKAVVQDRIDTVRNALKNGSSVEDISKVMGISLEEVEDIARGN